MYKNLEIEMIRKDVTQGMLAKDLNVHESTMSAKMNIPDRMKLSEAQKIRDDFFPACELPYLFAVDKETA